MHRTKYTALVLMLSLASLISCSNDQDSSERTAYLFNNVHVIPMTDDAVLENYDVLVVDNAIAEVADTATPPQDIQVVTIDGGGKYLLPGFIDSYTHVHEKSLIPELANGVTTVVNAIGAPFQHGLKFKVDQGEISGPRIFSVGSPIAGEPLFYHTQAAVAGEEAARQAVADTDTMGYDAVFTYTNIDSATYEAVIDEAIKRGLLTKGHVPFKIPREVYAQRPQRSFDNLVGLYNGQNGRTYPRDWLDTFATMLRENNSYLVPTLTIHKVRAAGATNHTAPVYPRMDYVLPRQKVYWHMEDSDFTDEGVRQIVRACHENGVRILVGTDGGFHFVPHGFAYLAEMKNLAEIGMSNDEILRAATIEAARYLRWENTIGSVEAGKEADLVLLDGNPLEDLDNAGRIVGVMTRGQWFDRNRIDQLLTDLKREIDDMPTRDRFASVEPMGENFNIYAQYEIYFKDIHCGSERIYNNDLRWVSQNVIDPPCERITLSSWKIDTTQVVQEIYLERESTAGEERGLLFRDDQGVKFEGIMPFKWAVEVTASDAADHMLGGPNTSINLDMDIAMNFIAMYPRISHLASGHTQMVRMKKIELNEEEWGDEAILGDVSYKVSRAADETRTYNDTSIVCQKYDIVETGFNGSPEFTFPAELYYDQEGRLMEVLFDEDIRVVNVMP